MIDQLLIAGFLQLGVPSVDCDPRTPPAPNVEVVTVKDGDTLVVADEAGTNWRVRMSGLDTPETFYFGENQGPWAYKASTHLKERLPVGTKVRLEYDKKHCDGRGRVLAHVIMGETDINRETLTLGYAVNYCVAPNYHLCDQYGQLAQGNFDKKTGFFSDPTVELPYLWRDERKTPSYDYWVGDLASHEVISSKDMASIPVGRRVIFYTEYWIRDPWHKK